MKKNGKSIFHTTLLAMLSVLAVEFLLLFLTLHLSNITQQLNQNAVDILNKQVENRCSYLENTMIQNQDLSSLALEIQTTALTLSEAGKIDFDTLDSSTEQALPLLQAVNQSLITHLRSKSITGIFLILNTHDLSTREEGSVLPGIYIRDMDPDSPASDRNADLLLERSPVTLVRSSNISTDKAWSPAFEFSNATSSFYYPVFQEAYNDQGRLDAKEYGRWTTFPYSLNRDNDTCIAYSIPLLLPDGTVYGVLGVEMLTSYMQSLMPASELQNEASGSYILASTHSDLSADSMQMIVSCSSAASSNDLNPSASLLPVQRSGKNQHVTVQNGVKYFTALKPLSFYSKNAPFSEEHWVLIGAVKISQLFAFSEHVMDLLILSVFLTLSVGTICCLIVSRHLARPIAKVSGEISQAQKEGTSIPNLSRTGIREVDQFAIAITQLSKDVLTSSTKFLRIMEMASVELGGYEIRQDTNSVFVTDNFFSMLGLPPQDPADLTPGLFQFLLRKFDQACPHSMTSTGDLVYCVTHPDGNIRYLRMETTQNQFSKVGLIEDVTSSTIERMRIEHERDFDPLTGLYNRRAFQRECELLFRTPKVLKHCAFLMLDLDNLKHTNDTYGHDFGDQYIRQTGLCFEAHAPKHALCARISGDEFNLLFYGYDSKDEIRAVIDHISKELQKKVLYLPDGQELHISISGGIAWYPDNAVSIEKLKKYADFAMYQAKHSQKGQLQEFDLATYEAEIHTVQSRMEFDRFIRDELVTYHFQPIVSAKTGEADAYEALMRVSLPTLTSPEHILKIARDEGQLHEIERITMFHASQAFLALRENHLIRNSDLLFINSIASQHMTQEENREYAKRFAQIQSNIVVEITEEESLDSYSLEVKRSMPGFSGMFALDDYGSGYSNQKSLLDLSPCFIKIDLAIIRNIHTSPDKQQIVSNIISYAHQRHIQIIAEGLETREEVEKALELGVDYLQGYYLARPAAVPPKINQEALNVILEFQKKA